MRKFRESFRKVLRKCVDASRTVQKTFKEIVCLHPSREREVVCVMVRGEQNTVVRYREGIEKIQRKFQESTEKVLGNV